MYEVLIIYVCILFTFLTGAADNGLNWYLEVLIILILKFNFSYETTRMFYWETFSIYITNVSHLLDNKYSYTIFETIPMVLMKWKHVNCNFISIFFKEIIFRIILCKWGLFTQSVSFLIAVIVLIGESLVPCMWVIGSGEMGIELEINKVLRLFNKI